MTLQLEKHGKLSSNDLTIGGRVIFAEVNEASLPKKFKGVIEAIDGEKITVRIETVEEKVQPERGIPMAKLEFEGELLVVPSSAIEMHRK